MTCIICTCAGCQATEGLWFHYQIRSAWSAETSADPSWTIGNPALGQCAVTALVVQDRYGGELLRVVNRGASHYFNRLPNGVEVDLTREQFVGWEPSKPEIRTREYVLSFEPTRVRYDLLRARIGGVA